MSTRTRKATRCCCSSAGQKMLASQRGRSGGRERCLQRDGPELRRSRQDRHNRHPGGDEVGLAETPERLCRVELQEGSRPRRRGTAVSEGNSSRGMWRSGDGDCRSVAPSGGAGAGSPKRSESQGRMLDATSQQATEWSKAARRCETARPKRESVAWQRRARRHARFGERAGSGHPEVRRRRDDPR